MDLMRSTYEQEDLGKKIQRTKPRAGDLLFRAGSTGRYVGIYLGNDQSVHASTSSGVMICRPITIGINVEKRAEC